MYVYEKWGSKHTYKFIYINKLLFRVTYNYICIYLFTHWEFDIYDPGDFNIS